MFLLCLGFLYTHYTLKLVMFLTDYTTPGISLEHLFPAMSPFRQQEELLTTHVALPGGNNIISMSKETLVIGTVFNI